MKKTFKILLALAIFIALDRFCHEATGTFSLYKITLNRPEDPTWNDPSQHPPSLNEPFTFLGHGNESFAFLSADKKTVLKVFKLQFLRPAYFKEMVRAPLAEWPETLVRARKARLDRTFSSIKIAYDLLREETALEYVHLTPTTHFTKPLILIDKLGISHTLDPNSLKFVLQKKADLVFPTLDVLVSQKKYDAVQAHVDSLLNLIEKRAALGIVDRDATLGTNFGFIDGKAVEIDIGSFSFGPTDPEKERALFQTLLNKFLTESPR
jgi:hypothetical protein